MIIELLSWWYSAGWLQAVRNIRGWIDGVERMFSMQLLLQTLFAPWHRIGGAGGRSFDAKIQASLDTFVSRIVGFFVRFIALLAGSIIMFAAGIAGIIIVVAWPLLPLAIIYCLIRSFTG